MHQADPYALLNQLHTYENRRLHLGTHFPYCVEDAVLYYRLDTGQMSGKAKEIRSSVCRVNTNIFILNQYMDIPWFI